MYNLIVRPSMHAVLCFAAKKGGEMKQEHYPIVSRIFFDHLLASSNSPESMKLVPAS